MNWASFFSLLATTIPAFIASLIMLRLKNRIDQSLEHVKTDLQEHITKFTKWHEKRIAALETIYQAFCKYLEFLRRALYRKHESMCLDPMFEFRNTLEQQMLYLEESMAEKVSQYEVELLKFWNWALATLRKEGEGAREKVQFRLDYEIPAYLPKLRKDINEALDPNYRRKHKKD